MHIAIVSSQIQFGHLEIPKIHRECMMVHSIATESKISEMIDLEE